MNWINVLKELPKKDELVLVWANGAVNCVTFNADKQIFEDWTHPTNPNITIDYIEYWCPIPPMDEKGKST